ncbi:hypothetical protein PIB30_112911, partial [Stylosanthes scabra]|nr:hypothetical protein [Stylosanthes scabra]
MSSATFRGVAFVTLLKVRIKILVCIPHYLFQGLHGKMLAWTSSWDCLELKGKKILSWWLSTGSQR